MPLKGPRSRVVLTRESAGVRTKMLVESCVSPRICSEPMGLERMDGTYLKDVTNISNTLPVHLQHPNGAPWYFLDSTTLSMHRCHRAEALISCCYEKVDGLLKF